MPKKIQAKQVASAFRSLIREQLKSLTEAPKLVGFLATDKADAEEYSNFTRAGCDDVGIEYELRKVHRLTLESAVTDASQDPSVHGIIVYYPVFNTARDSFIRGFVHPQKDVEGLNPYWLRKLYANERFDDAGLKRKAILPCTPLAIVKLIEAAGYFDTAAKRPLAGKAITIFNRSEVVGRPLAFMLANDGAHVYSYDIDGLMIFDGANVKESKVGRRKALGESDIVITGVPTDAFEAVCADEIKPGALCINFSMHKNFSPDAEQAAGCYIGRVGPVTIAMCLRNTVRLYENYHRHA